MSKTIPVARMSKAGSGILRRLAVLAPPSCPGLARASTSCLVTLKNVDGRDVGAKQSFVASHGHDGEFVHAAVVGRGKRSPDEQSDIRPLRRLAVLAPPSCRGLSRASTSCVVTLKNVD